jgi:hypothetical protein
MLKYNPNKLQMQLFNNEMKKIAKDQAAIET